VAHDRILTALQGFFVLQMGGSKLPQGGGLLPQQAPTAAWMLCQDLCLAFRDGLQPSLISDRASAVLKAMVASKWHPAATQLKRCRAT